MAVAPGIKVHVASGHGAAADEGVFDLLHRHDVLADDDDRLARVVVRLLRHFADAATYGA